MGTPKPRSVPNVGDWLQIPLSSRRWALGRVASVDPRGAMLCYFLDPWIRNPR